MNSLKNYRVLVTPTSYAKNDPDLRTELEARVGEVVYNPYGRPLNAHELIELIPEFDGYIAGLDVISRQVIESAGRLKVIARYGVGVDQVDLEAAREKGIVVTNTPGANTSAVAELAVGLILALARNIPTAVQAMKAGEWPRWSGISLEGKTVGLIGFGAIGQRVARRLSGFECTVIAYDPVTRPTLAHQLGVEMVSMNEVIRRSDFLSLHCPSTPVTHRLVDAGFLRKMKPGGYLINTARGELVDEQALADAIRTGVLRGAALDVFQHEPPEPGNPLLGLPQVIPTPHMGSHTDGAINAMGWYALKDCLAVLRGEEPEFRVV